MGSNIGEDFPGTGKKKDIEFMVRKFVSHGRHKVGFGIQHSLEQFLKLFLGHGGFHFKYLLPDSPVFKYLDGKIVEVYFQYPDTGLR